MPPDDLPGLPRDAVTAWLRTTLPDRVTDGDWTAEIVSGGLSNITYRLHTRGGELVLRRPPLAGVLQSAHDMSREFRVQSALAGTAVPVPPMLAMCADDSVIGAPFYVMGAVDGVVLRSAQDTALLTEAARQELAFGLVDTLVTLHAIDPAAVGLSDFGRPDGYSLRQLRRWQQQWEASKTRELPDMDTLIERLHTRLPQQAGSGLVHGDYRLDNTLVDVRATSPRITAVLDWELSTLGDPLADVALLWTYWEQMGAPQLTLLPGSAGATAHPGFPTAGDLAQRYAERSGRSLADLPFHRALAAMKLAAIAEGVHARYLGGRTVSAGYAGVGAAVPELVARGLAIIGPAPGRVR
ncbi:MAG: phosphotransferase family protein [Candidatus Nanopelagicales bacterium]